VPVYSCAQNNNSNSSCLNLKMVSLGIALLPESKSHSLCSVQLCVKYRQGLDIDQY